MTSSEPPQSATGPHGGGILAAAILVAAIGGGLALARRSDAPPQRPEPGNLLLSESFPFAAVSRRIRVKEPCTVEVSLDVPAGSAVKVALGPPVPPETSPEDAPDPGTSWTWTANAGDAPHREVVLASGVYVVRFVPQGETGGRTMTARVRALPPR